jgi:hypothetical protein
VEARATCRGCGAQIEPGTGNRKREWCSGRCRKRTLYSGTCESCGGPTNGYNGPGTAATVCLACLKWTSGAILEALRDWGDEHGGIPPREVDAHSGHQGHGRLPYERTVRKHFGSWNAGLLAAGYAALHKDRRPGTQEAVEAAVRSGETLAVIGDRFGVSAQAISQRLRYRGLSVRELREAALDPSKCGSSERAEPETAEPSPDPPAGEESP